MNKKNIAIILAAGKGSRMNSSIPKPLHKIAGKTIIEHILYNIKDAGYDDSVIVLNKENESFFSYLRTNNTDLTFAFQKDQLGTGDAVREGVKDLDLSEVENVLVVFGDTPLLSSKTLRDLLNFNDQSDITVLGFETSDPGRYGRLLVSNGKLLKIVETTPGWSHNITNIGKDEMIVLLWANEIFNPEKPDTKAFNLRR